MENKILKGFITISALAMFLIPGLGATTTVNIDGNSGGRVFEGIGMVNSSGTSKLLRDYPKKQQQEILDLLFKPDFGAGFTIVKNEIGSDSNTSSGTEPCTQRSEDEVPVARGVNFWICSQAKSRNLEIKFAAGRWGMPFWASLSEDAKKKYYLGYLSAMAQNKTPLDYLSPDENEGAFDRDWAVNILRPALDSGGYSYVSLVARDGLNWDIADMLENDEGLKKSLKAINCHYTTDSTAAAQSSGLPLYNDEADTPMRGIWKRLMLVAVNNAKQYVDGKMTRLLFQPGLDCVYDSIKYNCKGILTANTPWSGHYTVHPSLWMTAHFTQFAKPGWRFLDSGCGSASENEYYLTLRSPDTNDYSVIIINNSSSARDYVFNIGAKLSQGVLHVWRTTGKEQFIKIKDIVPAKGKFTIAAQPQAIYSLTTTIGQKKGGAGYKIPDDKALNLPYADDFSYYEQDKPPKYFYDQAGAFETVDVNGNTCLQQAITVPPIEWWGKQSKRDPYTLIGDQRWVNYKASVDVLLGNNGEALISGRGVLHDRDSDTGPSGYQIKLSSGGGWVFRKCLFGEIFDFASGTIPVFAPDKWHKISVAMNENTITAYIDGTQVAQTMDSTYGSGQAALGCNYTGVCFKDLKIEKIDESTPVVAVKYDDKDSSIKYTGTWENEDGNWMDFCRGVHKSNAAGATMEFAFNGTGVIITGRIGPNCGKADIYIDNVKQGTIGTYHAKTIYRAQLYRKEKLAAGRHSVKLVVAEAKDKEASDAYIYVDSMEYIGEK